VKCPHGGTVPIEHCCALLQGTLGGEVPRILSLGRVRSLAAPIEQAHGERHQQADQNRHDKADEDP
jgi:hypothetical protein